MKKGVFRIGILRYQFIIMSVFLLSHSIETRAADPSIMEESHLPIQLSEPLTGESKLQFGDGWAKAYVFTSRGDSFRLFPDEQLTHNGGIVFEGFDRSDVSPSGHFAVVQLVRQGTLDVPGEKSRIEGREYCPIVDTRTGCIVSLQTGEICGGQWATSHDSWIEGNVDRTPDLLKKTTMSAASIWHLFSHRTVDIKMHDLLMQNLGISNVIACDPLSSQNAKFYQSIASQLHADHRLIEENYIERSLRNINNGDKKFLVRPKKSPLYDFPSVAGKTGMYLIQGDVVSEIEHGSSGWIRIKYIEKSGKILLKWMRASDLDALE
jgi:hypothetical protein